MGDALGGVVAETASAYGGDVDTANVCGGGVAETASDYGGDVAARARDLDRELRRLARDDSAGRRVLGLLASRFIAIRGCGHFAFARFGDYAAERLGWSGRQLQEIASVAAALARLPAVERAFRCGRLAWSKTRLLAAVATPQDEEKWLTVAQATDTRTLATLTSNARAAAREQRRLHAAADAHSPGAATGECVRASSGDDEEGAEEHVLVRIPCTKRSLQMWSEASRLAPQLAGRALARWEVAQLIAAEASSAPGPYGELWQQEPWRNFAAERDGIDPRRAARDADANDANPAGAASAPEPPSPRRRVRRAAARPETDDARDAQDAVSPFERELDRLDQLDAVELDAAMRRVRTTMQRRQADLGCTLALFQDLRLHAELGYRSSADYVGERLGIPDRTARDLVRVARSAGQKSSALAAAYAAGELSWLRALTLLRVVRTSNAEAWIRRAGEVTLRRLTDEVAWAVEQSLLDPCMAAALPPPHDLDLGADDNRRMCARGGPADATGRGTAELFGILGRFHVTFLAPLSVSRLFRTVLEGFAHPAEPRWLALERMLEQVLAEWRRQPRHRDPVFDRDGYRCTAPGCSSRSNLHDHHIVPRSKGGTNEMSNRTTLCAWHHLRAVHGGLARASGRAPGELDWELGLAPGRTPLMRLRGDRYLDGTGR